MDNYLQVPDCERFAPAFFRMTAAGTPRYPVSA
jgi:hypothetical protein